MSKYSNIPQEDQVKKYATLNKLTLIDAYRALFSQKLLDEIDNDNLAEVLRELVYQVVGEGTKKKVSLIHVNGNVETN